MADLTPSQRLTLRMVLAPVPRRVWLNRLGADTEALQRVAETYASANDDHRAAYHELQAVVDDAAILLGQGRTGEAAALLRRARAAWNKRPVAPETG